MTRWKSNSTMLAGGLTLGLCVLGGLAVVWGQDAVPAPPAAPQGAVPQGAVPDEIKALLAARVALARQGYESAFAGVAETERINNRLIRFRQPEEAYVWSLRWLEAERALAADPAGRIAALESHLQRVTALEIKVKSLIRGPLPKWALLDAQWHSLDAQLWLAEAKAK